MNHGFMITARVCMSLDWWKVALLYTNVGRCFALRYPICTLISNFAKDVAVAAPKPVRIPVPRGFVRNGRILLPLPTLA